MSLLLMLCYLECLFTLWDCLELIDFVILKDDLYWLIILLLKLLRLTLSYESFNFCYFFDLLEFWVFFCVLLFFFNLCGCSSYASTDRWISSIPWVAANYNKFMVLFCAEPLKFWLSISTPSIDSLSSSSSCSFFCSS
jgi:hypothetical protein